MGPTGALLAMIFWPFLGLETQFLVHLGRGMTQKRPKKRPSFDQAPRQVLLLEVINDRGESHFHRTRHRGGRALPVPGSPEGRFISRGRVRFEV